MVRVLLLWFIPRGHAAFVIYILTHSLLYTEKGALNENSSVTDLMVARCRAHPMFERYYYHFVFKFKGTVGWAQTWRPVASGGSSGTHAMVGIDCEMVGSQNDDSSLVRVTVVC